MCPEHPCKCVGDFEPSWEVPDAGCAPPSPANLSPHCQRLPEPPSPSYGHPTSHLPFPATLLLREGCVCNVSLFSTAPRPSFLRRNGSSFDPLTAISDGDLTVLIPVASLSPVDDTYHFEMHLYHDFPPRFSQPPFPVRLCQEELVHSHGFQHTRLPLPESRSGCLLPVCLSGCSASPLSMHSK